MPGFAIGEGNWAVRTYTVATASTLSQGTAVCISNATGREISEYSGGQQGLLGFTLAASANSLPAGKIQVAVPITRECTAWCDMPTGILASSLSYFDCLGLYKPSTQGVTSYITLAYTSAASRCVQLTGRYDSLISRVEVAFIGNAQQFASISTTSIQ